MRFYADLHVHSRHSRATSRDADLEHMALWAAKKGVSVLGTGDFTHPGWLAEIRERLVPAEPGLFRLAGELEDEVERRLPPSCRRPVRFLLEVEISTIYKKGDRTRKVHHLVYAPDLESVERLIARLSRIGNLASDGRPILGLDSRDLLEIVLESGPASYLVPAHVWTPWFSALGSKSGFDSIEECYGDLAGHVFAIETGLSADPPMIWRVSGLDRFRLVSNSDAHSPPKIGREACVFDTDLDYFAMRRALETGTGYGGSIEFFPEEGKYHLDGHRKCGIRFEPEETARHGGVCPVCEKEITVGVVNRVAELADRPADRAVPAGASPFRCLVPLPEVIGEIADSGPGTRCVQRSYEQVVSRLGPELHVLEQTPLDEIRRAGSSALAEALDRMRRGRVIRDPGYDGEYGRIRLFEDGEVAPGRTLFLFETPAPVEAPRPEPRPRPAAPVEAGPRPGGLDPEQIEAIDHPPGPLLVVAGPGAGKTRILVERLARRPIAARSLAITFTRRAAEELAERLAAAGTPGARATTFHALGLSLLEEHADRAGLARPRVASEAERAALLAEALGVSEREAGRLLERRDIETDAVYRRSMDARGWLDFDDLVDRSAGFLEADPAWLAEVRARHDSIAVDEYQDVDERQHRLLTLVAPPGADLCAIGDPDQSIYGFRGADVHIFQRFASERPGTRTVTVTTSHRSGRPIVESAARLIAPASLVPDRVLRAAREGGAPVSVHHAASDRGEADFVVRSIERLLGGTSLYSMDSGRVVAGDGEPLSFSDFAVLFRAKALAGPVEEALARAGIPFQNRSHAPLSDDPATGEFLDALEAGRPLEGFHPGLRALAAECGGRAEELRSRLALGQEVDLWDPRADRVSLLTLHASKGLEFRVVFVIGCDDGVLPLSFGPGDGTDPAEERRLLFVGMTRARDRLHLTTARERLWRGAVRTMQPSPFLCDLPAEFTETTRAAFDPRPVAAGRQLELF